ncbi:MAG TPA: S8 family serine peptidase [Candidatus Saccharimonadaceae bacterium]|nr:S8 family serine peptidase [Candidatus Saccharimonadaceae bacterium]
MRRSCRAFAVLLVAGIVASRSANAANWLWDQNANRIDDRIEAVETQGLTAAHRNGDLAQPPLLFVFGSAPSLEYGVYVAYDHHPTDGDVAALSAGGARLLWRPRYIDYLRARATFAEIQALAATPGVRRVEAWQVMVAFNDNATRTLRARDAAGGVGAGMFPSAWRDLGITGRGVVVGIIDTGVNDAAANAYPGHESLIGKFVGGGDFSNPVAELNTPPDSSANPMNSVDPLGDYHATHVAGTAIGSGGPQGVLAPGTPFGAYAGMAPDARLVDCKALSDAGEGGGASEALEWCIAHRNTVWGTDETGAVYRGVQVVNMSLGGMSASDGTDADAVEVNAAVRAGIVVCVATGNDGNTAYMPSPAAADLDVSVGALQDGNTLPHADDIVADYSNEGPRTSDGDDDHLDEMKPTVCGSGSDIVSALGDPTTDGRRYHNINGTSMATPTVAGLCALILQANPSLTPLEVRNILEHTSEHRRDHGKQPESAADPFGIDPNYHPSWGWGEPDAVAAVEEALNPATTQVVAEGATPALLGGQLEIAVRWVTQREVGVTRFDVYRAPDLGGTPGTFALVSPDVAPHGSVQIERTLNRTPYVWTDGDASLVPGQPYWYEVRWTDGVSRQHVEPAFRVTTDTPPVRARVRWAITHNALDNDIFARFGSGTDPNAAAFLRPCGGTPAADSSTVVVPVGFGSMTRWFFHADLTDADMAGGFLPPSAANPWFLSALEKGFVNTEGFVDSFSVTVFDGPLATVYRAPNPSTPTAEGQTTTFWIPMDPATALNHSPVLDPIGPQSGYEGLNLHFTVHATDPDGQALTYSAAPLPLGATFTASTRTFAWQPAFGQAGTYHVTFHAADSQLAEDSEDVTLTIAARTPGSNTAPVLDPLADHTTHVNSTMRFALSARDREGDALTFSGGGLPPGAALDAASGALAWTPGTADAGSYAVTFRVADTGGLADSATIVLSAAPGVAPIAASCAPETTAYAGHAGLNAQGVQDVHALQPFVVGPGVSEIRGALSWTGAPAVDLDLYLLDPQGNEIASGATATNDPERATYATPSPGTYQWKVVTYQNADTTLVWNIASVQCMAPSLAVPPAIARTDFALGQNEPNPFQRSSLIRFTLPTSGPVTLRIYDVTGRRVRSLVDGWLMAGSHQRVWEGIGDDGTRARAGVYFYRLSTPRGALSRRMILLR